MRLAQENLTSTAEKGHTSSVVVKSIAVVTNTVDLPAEGQHLLQFLEAGQHLLLL